MRLQIARTYLKIGQSLSTSYKCRMIRLNDSEWERIRIIFRKRTFPKLALAASSR